MAPLPYVWLQFQTLCGITLDYENVAFKRLTEVVVVLPVDQLAVG